MEMSEGWLYWKDLIGREQLHQLDDDCLESILDLMKEMAEALAFCSTHSYEESAAMKMKINRAEKVLSKFKEWK